MDVFYPLMPRPLLPGEPRRKLIGPVSKYTRIMPVHPNREHESSWQVVYATRDARQQHSVDHSAEHGVDHSAEQSASEPQLLQTSHHETPAADQHADADGHLDLYV
jgi:hypothetical protein